MSSKELLVPGVKWAYHIELLLIIFLQEWKLVQFLSLSLSLVTYHVVLIENLGPINFKYKICLNCSSASFPV